MELVNSSYKFKPSSEQGKAVFGEALRTVMLLLEPFAPHISEELAEICCMSSVSSQEMPEICEEALQKEDILIVVQVNGKVRDRLMLPADISVEDIEKEVRYKDYSKFLKSGEIKKMVYVPGKLINVVG